MLTRFDFLLTQSVRQKIQIGVGYYILDESIRYTWKCKIKGSEISQEY